MGIQNLSGTRSLQFLAGLLILASVAGCQPRATPDDPVFAAVRSNDAGRIGQYLAEGGDPNRLDPRGESLLHVATGARGGEAVARALLIGGADPDVKNAQGRTPLHNAAGWCDLDTVRILIEAGADTSMADIDGQTPVDAVCAEPLDRRHETIALLSGAGG